MNIVERAVEIPQGIIYFIFYGLSFLYLFCAFVLFPHFSGIKSELNYIFILQMAQFQT
jgi:hypothetical protein